MVVSNTRTTYQPFGAAYDLMWSREAEVLLEGPAGTGKTRGLLEKLHWVAMLVPGVRILICRQTRASMTESVLVTYEEKVLPANSPIARGPLRRNRQSYSYPNGSVFVVGGLDNTDRIMSTEYDIVALFEATEASEESWEKLQTRLRNNILDYQQAVADCNPAHFAHWLNRRAARPDKGNPDKTAMQRLLSRHEDNPSVTPQYLRILDNLTGARHDRLRKGLWVAEEGLIYQEWDPTVHVVPFNRTLNTDGSSRMRWYFGVIDWGYRNPGCFQVWGVDGDKNMYRVLETYRTLKKIEWWADRVEQAHEKYNLRNLVCDSAEPENIEVMNDRLGTPGHRTVGAKAIPADKSWMTGRDSVGEALRPSGGGPPMMYLVDDAQSRGGGVDRALADTKRPVSTEEEFLGYTWDLTREGQPVKERPQSDLDDHGLDCARYGARFLWKNDLCDAVDDSLQLPIGSIGHELGWGDDLRGVDYAGY